MDEELAPAATPAPPEGGRGGGARTALPYGVGAAVGALLAAVALLAAGSLTLPGTAASPAPSATPAATATPGPALLVEGPSIGPADAPITMEVWADYQCPFCGLFAHAIEPGLVREYAGSGKARLTFRDFAFLGPESFDAAVAARCAGRQRSYWRYHDLLFAAQRGENQGAFARPNLLTLARIAGLDDAAFTACLDAPSVRQAVVAETDEGRRLGVKSTPTLRIVGPGGSELLVGVSDFAGIAAAIDRMSASPSPSSPTPSPAGSAVPTP